MAKDPAFLFYYHDFLVGTHFMTHEEVGCYIRILCHLADKSYLPHDKIVSICSPYAFTENLKSKLHLDDNGCYYNHRLNLEVEKRRNFTESRRKNALAYAKHMGNENENINVNDNTVYTVYTVPTVHMIIQYCKDRKNGVDGQKFHDFYSSKGWMIGKNKMKDWKACVRTWEKNGVQTAKTGKKRKDLTYEDVG